MKVIVNPRNLNHDPEQREILDKRKKLDLIPDLGTCAEVVDLSVYWDDTIVDTMVTTVHLLQTLYTSALNTFY